MARSLRRSLGSRVAESGGRAAGNHEAPDSAGACGPERMAGLGGRLGGYSPITAQRKPIMMKKPLNIAMSASAP